MKIDVSEDDHKIVSTFSSEVQSDLDLIRTEESPLSEQTLEKLSLAWVEAQQEAEITDMKFSLRQELKGRDLLGHITNLCVCGGNIGQSPFVYPESKWRRGRLHFQFTRQSICSA
jgi:hypothetical protein